MSKPEPSRRDQSRPTRCVLVAVDDEALRELLREALVEAGHRVLSVDGPAAVPAAFDVARFDAAIIDMDTSGPEARLAVAHLSHAAPSTTVIALLPCGGPREPTKELAPGHLALEKPARLRAILAAVVAEKRPD